MVEGLGVLGRSVVWTSANTTPVAVGAVIFLIVIIFSLEVNLN